MSEHIHGNINQAVRSDFGEMITLGNVRFRVELVKGYMAQFDPEAGKETAIKVLIDNGWLVCDLPEKDIQKELSRLDWIYRKEAMK